MNFPPAFSSSGAKNVTGTLPPNVLDATGRRGVTVVGDAPVNAVPNPSKVAEAQNGLAEKQEEVLVDKKALCIELLVGGCVNSFVDFLKITHKGGKGGKFFCCFWWTNSICDHIHKLIVEITQTLIQVRDHRERLRRMRLRHQKKTRSSWIFLF